MFLTESQALSEGKKDLLLLGISDVKISKEIGGNLSVTMKMPEPDCEAYVDTREGRAVLEGAEGKDFLREVNNAPNNTVHYSNGRAIRGISAGVAYFYGNNFILHSKAYPKTHDQYFSIFSGLSESVREIRNPRRIAIREGLEEFLMCDDAQGILYLPSLDKDPFFKGCLSPEELKELRAKAKANLATKLNKPEINYYNINGLNCYASENTDILNITSRSTQSTQSTWVMDINPHSNSIDLIKTIRLPAIPEGSHLYAPEFMNDVAIISPDQLRSIWSSWGKNVEVDVYTHEGTKERKKFPAYFDSLVQRVAMHLGVISGKVRFDYKKYGLDSI